MFLLLTNLFNKLLCFIYFWLAGYDTCVYLAAGYEILSHSFVFEETVPVTLH